MFRLTCAKILVLSLALLPGLRASAQLTPKTGKGSVIEIVRSGSFEFDERKIKRLTGGVQFRQDDVLLDCDSAYLYDKENNVDAFGHVVIHRSDSFFLYGDKLHYEGNTKKPA